MIRRMLGVEYGDTSLVLPKWRLEGADNPFVIRLFPGFFSYRCASIHIVLAAVSLGVILLWDTSLLSHLSDRQTFVEEPKIPIAFAITWYAILLLVFRYQLREQNENAWLLIGRFVSWAFRLPLARNFEDNLYNVRLSIAEAHRLEADFQALENLAVAIEDKSFWKHRGLNYRGLARAAIGRLQGKSAGGGSSITQQFVRTNFIYDLSPPLRRKLVESILAKWAESALTKQEILHGYLATARFDRSVYGFHNAFKHFFGDHAKKVEPFEAFILIERLGNVQSHFLGKRIRQLMQRLIDEEELNLSDCENALKYYEGFIGHHFFLKDGDLTPNLVQERLKHDNRKALEPNNTLATQG